MKKRTFLENASFSTVMLVATKLIGIIPVFFLDDILGSEGFYAYGFAYTFAIIALDLANAGIPVGISRYVARSNEKGDYLNSYKLFKFASITIFIFSVFIGLLLFLCAPILALGATESSREIVIFAIRMFVPTVIVVPVLGVVRGFFQGHRDTIPGSLSQFVDNLSWFIFLFTLILSASLIFNNSVIYKTGFAMFASFFGAISGGIILYLFFRLYQPHWQKQIEKQTVQKHLSMSQLMVALIVTSLPLTLSVFIMNGYAIVSDILFANVLSSNYSTEAIHSSFSILVNISPKIASLPLVVANTLALASIPFIVTLYHRNDIKELSIQVKQSLLITFLIMCIAAVLTVSLGPILYQTLFYMPGESVNNQIMPLDINIHRLNASVLATDGLRALSLGMATIFITVLQSINRAWKAIAYVLIGGVVKFLATLLFLNLFGPVGDIYGSIVAYGLVIYLSYNELLDVVMFSKLFYRHTIVIIVAGFSSFIAMSICLWIVRFQVSSTRNLLTMSINVVELLAVGTIGVAVYGFIVLYFKTPKYIFSKKKI